MLGRYSESDKAFDETIEMIPPIQAENSRGLDLQGHNFIGQNNSEEALKAFEKVTELDPQEPAGWHKGEVLKALGRQAEADEALPGCRELGYNVQKESGAEPSSTPKCWPSPGLWPQARMGSWQ